MSQTPINDREILENPAAYVKRIKAIQDSHDDILGLTILKECMASALAKRKTINYPKNLEKTDLQMLAKRFHVSLSRDITVSPQVYHFTLLVE